MRTFRITRLYDEDGTARFEDVDLDLDQEFLAPPAAPLDMAVLGAATTALLVGGDRDWAGLEPHPAPARQLMTTLSGRVRVTSADGEERVFGPGDLLLLEDTTGSGHRSAIVEDDAIALFVQLGPRA